MLKVMSKREGAQIARRTLNLSPWLDLAMRKIANRWRSLGSLPLYTGTDRSGSEGFVTVRFVMFQVVHALAQHGERLIETQTRPTLITQRAVLGHAMPRVV